MSKTEDRCGAFKDHHSNKWENHPGKVLSMPRNKISDDPRTPCHEGFHVGALRHCDARHGRSRHGTAGY